MIRSKISHLPWMKLCEDQLNYTFYTSKTFKSLTNAEKSRPKVVGTNIMCRFPIPQAFIKDNLFELEIARSVGKE